MKAHATIYAPIVECVCGSRTIFDEGSDRYDFVCRVCGLHMDGLIPSPGVVGREFDARSDGTPHAQGKEVEAQERK